MLKNRFIIFVLANFELSIAEHAQRAFGGTNNLFLLYGNAVPIKQKERELYLSLFSFSKF